MPSVFANLVKRYRLLGVFLMLGAVVFMLAAGLLVVAVQVLTERQWRTMVADSNAALTRAFSNQHWSEFQPLLMRADYTTAAELWNSSEMAQQQAAIARLVQGTRVLKIKIYNLTGWTIFSTEAAQIGVDYANNPHFQLQQRAARGEAQYSIGSRARFEAIGGPVFDRWIVSSYLPLRMSDSTPIIGVIEIYTDVTDTVAAVNIIRLQLMAVTALAFIGVFAALCLIVSRADRMIQGQRDALENLVERSKQASQAKSLFLANMSHEIRTPLNGVLGMADLMLTTELTGRQKRIANTIASSGRSLMTIIDDILDLSKIEAGKMELDPIDFVLPAAIEDAVDLFAERAAMKKIALQIDIDPLAPRAVHGDPGRLRQVIGNLVSNAVKFTESGSIAVALQVIKRDEQNVHCRVSVRDSGIGIDSQSMTRIFEAFTQADQSTGRRFGGTGLGLAIVKQLVAMMGGEIGANSEVGRGSEFWFTVRFGVALESTPHHSKVAALFAGKRVLILEANGAACAPQIQTHLDLWNISSDIRYDAPEAQAALRAAVASGRPHDLVILSPGSRKDVAAMIDMIRDDQPQRCAPIVLVGGGGDDLKASDLKAMGVAALLPVPIRQSGLYDALAAIFEGRLAAATLGVEAASPAPLIEGARVLVAEDNAVNAEVASQALSHLGVEADIVENGERCVMAWRSGRYAMIFMDCFMPVLDGFEAARRIRAQEEQLGLARIPIVALTANALRGDREQCLAAGMDDYLSKPFGIDQLRAKLSQWLPQGSTAAPEPGDAASPIDAMALDLIRTLQRPGAPDAVSKIIRLYLEDAPMLIADLEAGLAGANAEAVRMAAHTLASTSAQVGAQTLSRIAREIEQKSQGGLVGADASAIAELRSEFARVQAALADQIVHDVAAAE